ncbi:ABC transporter substrate-binding protein [Paenibacillus ginsengarvi]|uniref:Extracellular solute-binding protein n=1 Tax=Paenibacillus ginsengarvi TaxID=400777 RepID=A0A3B0ALB1_9BACL|nr:extracellular solute-binding protein [Paenibacillus ginsengarvi]RKN61338.1 extracellular solute-binding protein [Paenibacillus ginsengarvi]
MKMNRRIPVGAGMGLAIALVTAACGGANDKGEPTSPGAVVKSYADEPAELVIFGAVGNTEEVWDERFGTALKAKFPKYKFTYIQGSAKNTLQNHIAAGQPVDLVHDSLGGMRGNMIDNRLNYDLAPLMKSHQIDTSRFEQPVFDALSDKGKLYGFPLHDGGLVLYYNKDIFDKFGVPYPKNGMTWDETITLGKRLTRFDGGVQYLGLGVSINHMLTMNPYSLPFVNETSGKAAIHTDAYRKLVNKTILEPAEADGYRPYLISSNKAITNDNFMKDKNLAMFVMNFYLQLQPDFSTFNWGIVSLPVFGDLPGVGSQPYPNGLFVSSSSKYKDQGMEVLNYLVSDEFQMSLSRKGFIPVVKTKAVRDAYGADTAFKDKQIAEALYANKPAAPMPRSTYENLVLNPLSANLSKAMKGEMDLNTALRVSEEQANKALEEAVRK